MEEAKEEHEDNPQEEKSKQVEQIDPDALYGFCSKCNILTPNMLSVDVSEVYKSLIDESINVALMLTFVCSRCGSVRKTTFGKSTKSLRYV